MATIADVAREARVSTATVSHVLNGTRRVAPATKARVEAAVVALQYRPSAIARGLSTNRSRTIGVVVADITNPFYGTIVRGIERLAAERDYSLIVCNTDESVERESAALRMLTEKRVDGLVIAPTGVDQPEFRSLSALGIPTVFIDRAPPESTGPVVAIDNPAAGYMATKHLVDLGHRRIAIVARQSRLSTATGRVQGYKKCLKDARIEAPPTLIRYSPQVASAATEQVLALLRSSRPPSAIVLCNHIMTLGALEAIRVEGIRCPDALSLVCFDDHAFASLLCPPLTVVRMPIQEMCQEVVSILFKALDEPRRQHQAKTGDFLDIRLEAALVVRNSTGRVDSIGEHQ